MANINDPRGFIPYKKEGKLYKTRAYEKTAGELIYTGDLLKRVAAGTVSVYVVGDAEPIVGVAAHYSAAASTDPINVYDDPEMEFVCQIDATTAYAAADRGLNVDIKATPVPDTALNQSGQVIDMATKAATATLPLKVLDLAPAINQEENSEAINADIIVKVNRSERGNLATGI
jgi:hypothetical protein